MEVAPRPQSESEPAFEREDLSRLATRLRRILYVYLEKYPDGAQQLISPRSRSEELERAQRQLQALIREMGDTLRTALALRPGEWEAIEERATRSGRTGNTAADSSG